MRSYLARGFWNARGISPIFRTVFLPANRLSLPRQTKSVRKGVLQTEKNRVQYQKRAKGAAALRPYTVQRGKSEHHRTGYLLTAGGGDSRASATERNRSPKAVRMERRGKSSPASGRPGGHVNPTRCNTDRDAMVGPAVPKGGTEQRRRRPAKIDCRNNRTRLTASVAFFPPGFGRIFLRQNQSFI